MHSLRHASVSRAAQIIQPCLCCGSHSRRFYRPSFRDASASDVRTAPSAAQGIVLSRSDNDVDSISSSSGSQIKRRTHRTIRSPDKPNSRGSRHRAGTEKKVHHDGHREASKELKSAVGVTIPGSAAFAYLESGQWTQFEGLQDATASTTRVIDKPLRHSQALDLCETALDDSAKSTLSTGPSSRSSRVQEPILERRNATTSPGIRPRRQILSLSRIKRQWRCNARLQIRKFAIDETETSTKLEHLLDYARERANSSQAASAISGTTNEVLDGKIGMDQGRDICIDKSDEKAQVSPLGGASTRVLPLVPLRFPRQHTRAYHRSSHARQNVEALLREPQGPPAPVRDLSSPGAESSSIRDQLRKWQELHGDQDQAPAIVTRHDISSSDEPTNSLTRLSDQDGTSELNEDHDDRYQSSLHFNNSAREHVDGSTGRETIYMQTGDLVEIEFPKSERESILAVYVRPLTASLHQLFTIHGRWTHVRSSAVQYSVPGWIDPQLVEPIVEHLPTEEDVLHREDLDAKAFLEDWSVPREVAAPLVARLLHFDAESQEIYRRHASALDNAHQVLAHETDLRYGSVNSVTKTLLNTTGDHIPLPALYAVHKALSHAGFAFDIDRHSHRMTGFVQIRSKSQVKMVHTVRDWLRQWQEDLASKITMDERQLKNHQPVNGARYVYSFIEKAKEIVLKSRETRARTAAGNVGPSTAYIALTKETNCVESDTHIRFSAEEEDIVRFMEFWACSQLFFHLPRLLSLPPLVLQATGLYEDLELGLPTGHMFLQELGTIMPYENRIKFDRHLLLPSSQQSRSLQRLMTTLMSMKNQHGFQDSMAGLRRDWGSLPVYCIDGAEAQEIDDGISVEEAGWGPDGKEQYWVHIHIANPTAFFSRDSPISKMARHMGETIYMPERAYVMLPHWTTRDHFSLGRDRPCLTFSAKMDTDGQVVDQNITNGIVRNVKSLTPGEVESLFNADREEQPEVRLVVGGDPPPARLRKSSLASISAAEVNQLRILQQLAEVRQGIRKKAGGILFDSQKPEVNVWQRWQSTGLSWDIPWRSGSRTVKGDPVIELRTRGLMNWFAPFDHVVDTLVREMMLLACEISASWCARRQIPIIYRGTVRKPFGLDPEEYYQNVLLPATSDSGEYPFHLGIQYLESLGSTVFRTKPIRHRFLGMDHYTKATSPLRRYGDMILHWQIEAALRHEAETGRSLVTEDPNAARPFLPFSAPALEAVALGLQPREQAISDAKAHSEYFWQAMLLFRKFYFPDSPTSVCPADSDPLPEVIHAYVLDDRSAKSNTANTMTVELNTKAFMLDPERLGLTAPKRGDIWECRIDQVNVYSRSVILTPVRLTERPDV